MEQRKVCIKNGVVYDPLNGINGEKMDIFVYGNHISEEIKDADVLDVNGCVVMPAGIDVHRHVATFGINFARFLFGFPTVSEMGREYAMMGYSHVNEPLMTIDTASYVHHELASIPFVDASAFLAISLREIANEIREGDHETVRGVFSHLVEMTKAIGIMIHDARVSYKRKGFFYRDIDMQTCMRFLSAICCDCDDGDKDVSCACSGCGVLVLRTRPDVLSDVPMDVLSAFRLAHISSGIINDETYERAYEFLREGGFAYIVPHDVIHDASGGNADARDDRGGGSVIIDIGFDDPLVIGGATEKSEICMKLAIDATSFRNNLAISTGSPTDAAKFFAALMDRNLRRDVFGDAVPSEECSLLDVVRMRSANAARFLGIEEIKGHLGVGALADIAIYEINEQTRGHDLARKLQRCEFMLKGGDFVVHRGDIVGYADCRTFYRMNERAAIGQQQAEQQAKQQTRQQTRQQAKQQTRQQKSEAGERAAEEEKVKEVLRRICDSRSFRREHLRVDDIFLRRAPRRHGRQHGARYY